MNKLRALRFTTLIALVTLPFALPSQRAIAQQTQLQGVIDGRSGPTMSLRLIGAPDATVLLTDSTDVGEVEGVFHGRTKQMPMTALIPGLPVQVKGALNDQNQLVADSVKFKGSDLKAAVDAQAGLQPTEQKVAANSAAIQQSQQELAAQQAALQAQQAQLTAEQQTPLLAALNQQAGDTALAIGPEGGWTPDEMALFTTHNWQHVTLGPRILRAETAAIAAIAIASSQLTVR